MTFESSDLREAIVQCRAGRTRWRCPLPLRAQVVAYAQERQRAGITLESIATDLGLSKSGLLRWLKAVEPLKAGAARLRPVRMAETPSRIPETLTLITPQGFRLEGLSPASAADVLRRLT